MGIRIKSIANCSIHYVTVCATCIANELQIEQLQRAIRTTRIKKNEFRSFSTFVPFWMNKHPVQFVRIINYNLLGLIVVRLYCYLLQTHPWNHFAFLVFKVSNAMQFGFVLHEWDFDFSHQLFIYKYRVIYHTRSRDALSDIAIRIPSMHRNEYFIFGEDIVLCHTVQTTYEICGSNTDSRCRRRRRHIQYSSMHTRFVSKIR